MKAKKWIVGFLASLMVFTGVSAVKGIAKSTAKADDNSFVLTFEESSAREDWAESSKLSKDYLLDGTQTIGYQSADVYAGSEAIVVTETAGTTSGQAIINTHARGPISSWDANTAYTVSFMLKGAPIHLYFDHGGMVILDDWIRPGDDWTYYEYTFTPSEVKEGAEVVRYSFLVKVAEANKQAYIDDFYIEEYKAPKTAAVTVGSAIGSLPALASGKAWAIDGQLITADTVWTYTENKTATAIDVDVLSFAYPDMVDSLKSGDYGAVYNATAEIDNGVLSFTTGSADEATNASPWIRLSSDILPAGDYVVKFKMLNELYVNIAYEVEKAYGPAEERITLQNNVSNKAEWTEYEYSISLTAPANGLYLLIQSHGPATAGKYDISIDSVVFQRTDAFAKSVVKNNAIGALPALHAGQTWAIDGEAITADTVWAFDGDKTATVIETNVLSFVHLDMIDSMESDDYGVVYNATSEIIDGDVLKFVTGSVDGKANASPWILLSSAPLSAGKYIVKFKMQNDIYVNLQYEAGKAYGPAEERIVLQNNVSNKTDWTAYEYDINLTEAVDSLYLLINAHGAVDGGSYAINVNDLQFAKAEDFSKPVITNSKIGELPALGQGQLWAIDGEIITADTVWTFDTDKVATVTFDPTEYTVTFVADGKTVDTVTYTLADKKITAPAVPSKTGYEGKWADYKLIGGDLTVEAIYTAIIYTVTFVADDVTVGTATYTVEDKAIDEPAVPVKSGFDGAWESYELTVGDITVEAVYTEKVVESSSEEDSEEESSEEEKQSEAPAESQGITSVESTEAPEEKGGCLGSVTGAGVGTVLAGFGAMLIRRKRKED